MVTNIQKKNSLNFICPLGVWICFIFYKFCIFTFLPFYFHFFALSAQFSYVFLPPAQLSLDIFQKFQRIFKEGLNALLKVWHMYLCESQIEMEIEMESKNSGSYGDLDIFFLIVGHREVKNFC